ncbi:MAG: type II secretion system F family protein [Bryobacteraceae bacterium]|nr:type II secretion system F family protein [Bryobacteraceae bacterium]
MFVVLLVAITGFGYVFFVRPKSLLHQLEEITSTNFGEEPAVAETAGGWKVVSSLQWIGEKMPLSPQESSFTRRELAAAGYRGDNAVAVFVGIRLACAVVLTLLAFIFRHRLVANSTLGLVMVGLVAVGSYFLVGFVLSHLVDARRDRLRLSLPDALDLLVVCVEAGQGIDQAMRVVSRELEFSHRELSEELSLVSLEMRAGKARSDALSHMAERTGEAEMKKLVSVLIQTDRFGTSVGEALRTHGDYLRVRRSQEAEERAGKVGVKLIFPIFFCIMPSIMIVSAGPGMLMLFRQLGTIVQDMK